MKATNRKYRLVTFGCKVNRVDSGWLAENMPAHLSRAADDEPADVCIINTCALTSRAVAEARRLCSRYRRENPGALIAVVGCIPAADKSLLEGFDCDLIVDNRSKSRLPHLIERALVEPGANIIEEPAAGTSAPPVLAPQVQPAQMGRTRAFLAVQDGCNSFCSYCIVPHTRGKPRSMPPDEVIKRGGQLAAAGYRELVLCGIHLGLYGVDLPGKSDLAGLIARIADAGHFERIRISSLEPNEVDDTIVGLFEKYPALCRHFHLSLQSGDDRILKAMNRHYCRDFFRRAVGTIRDRLGDVGLGLDVITGFPGEDQKAFENTYNFIEALPATYLHVFSFSPRPGTPAAKMTGLPNGKTVSERSRKLRRLSDKMRRRFYGRQIGAMSEVLFENCENGHWRGYSRRYIPVAVKSDQDMSNRIVEVRLDSLDENSFMLGQPQRVW